jgi:hypothetical protein
MKTKNKLIITAMALVTIVVLSLAVIGCEEECDCPPNTVHYGKPCDCGVGNCSDNCTVRYSVGNTTFGTTPVPVYAGAGVTDEEVEAVIAKIDAAWSYVSDNEKTILAQTKKIVIVLGTVKSADKATWTIEIGKDLSAASISSFLEFIAAPAFNAQIKSAARDTIRMAKAPFNGIRRVSDTHS